MGLEEIRKTLMLLESDLAQVNERVMVLFNLIVEVLNEHESRIGTLEDDSVKREISFYAKKLGVSESEFLKNVADFIRRGGLKVE
ncbi:MAG: hypothetical protein QXF61_01110 [Nitrososphaeria archaeon]